MCRCVPRARDASAFCGASLFLTLVLRSCSPSLPSCILSLSLSLSLSLPNFLLIVLVASFLCSPLPPPSQVPSLPLFPSSLSPSPPPPPPLSLSLSLFLFRHPCDTAHTRVSHYHARESRARATTHMAGRPLLLAECAVLPPLQGTVSRGPQAATARSAQHGLCSFVSRAHDTSQRRTERPDRQIALSLPGSACGAFSLPLFLSPILFLSPFSPFFVLSPCATVSSLSSSLLSPCCPDWRARARDTSRLWVLCDTPATFPPSDLPAGHVQQPPQCCVFTRRRVPLQDSRLANSSAGGILSVLLSGARGWRTSW